MYFIVKRKSVPSDALCKHNHEGLESLRAKWQSKWKSKYFFPIFFLTYTIPR